MSDYFAGGTAGAVAGPALTTFLAGPLGPTNLLLLSAAFLLGAVVCIQRLSAWRAAAAVAARFRTAASCIAASRPCRWPG